MDRFRATSVLTLFSDMVAKRYALVGLFVTAISYVFLFFCVAIIGLDNLAANFLTLMFGMCFSYLLNRRFSFGDRRMMRESVFHFIAVTAIAYSANLIILYLLLNFTGIADLLAQVVSFSVYTLIAYVLHRFWTFGGAQP